MSQIENLIKKHCPNGVEFIPFSNVMKKFTLKAKNAPEIKLVYAVSKTDGIIPSLDYWGKNTSVKRVDTQIYSDDISNYNVIRKGMFAYNPARLNIGSISCLFDGEDGLLSPMYCIFEIDEKKLTQKYVYYFIKSTKTIAKFDAMKEVGARFRFDFKNWEKIKIPIPPIEVQNEIVKILDNFTKLEAELEAELEARRRQYYYYRDKLLSFDTHTHTVKWVSLGEICEIVGRIGFRGYTSNDIVKDENGAISLSPGNISDNCINFDKNTFISWEKYEESPEIKIYENDIVFVKTGSTVGKVAIVKNLPQKTTINPQLVVLKNISCDNKFLFYILSSSKFQNLIKKITKIGSVPTITQKDFSKLKIPLPNLEKQKEIVEILDKFDALVNDLSVGLPAEINARKKQYEFYRDKLLSFDEMASF